MRSRSVDRFSHTMRVLARREPVNRRDARLVVAPGRAAVEPPVVTTKGTRRCRGRRPRPVASAAKRATRRRRRVLGLILLANARRRRRRRVRASSLVVRRHPGRPAGRLAGRLPADGPPRAARSPAPARPSPCRRRSSRCRASRPPAEPRSRPSLATTRCADTAARSPRSPTRACGTRCRSRCRRTSPSPPPSAARVRTIDLDSTGVWTSGRTEADAQMAREADEADEHGACGSRATATGAARSAPSIPRPTRGAMAASCMRGIPERTRSPIEHGVRRRPARTAARSSSPAGTAALPPIREVRDQVGEWGPRSARPGRSSLADGGTMLRDADRPRPAAPLRLHDSPGLTGPMRPLVDLVDGRVDLRGGRHRHPGHLDLDRPPAPTAAAGLLMPALASDVARLRPPGARASSRTARSSDRIRAIRPSGPGANVSAVAWGCGAVGSASRSQ